MPDPLRLQPYIADSTLCVDEIPLLTLDALLPHWEDQHSRRFNRYYRALADAFDRACRTQLLPQAEALYRQALTDAAPLPQWHAALRARFTYRTDSLVSLCTDTVLTGTPYRQIFRRGDTWELRHGLPLALPDFFPPRAPYRRRMLRDAEAQIEAEQAQGISLYHADHPQLLRRYFHPHRFYLTEEGLCFFYPACTIAPAAEGIPTFCLPYDGQKGPFLPKI